MKNGIVFFKTKDLQRVSKFYQEEIGCEIWLDQGGCHILKFGNMLLGFCQRETVDNCGITCFVFADKAGVDMMYHKLSDLAQTQPEDNPEYRIYHFFATDPDGRNIEFQYFWDDVQ